jgi:hypothetical protein
MPGPTPKLSVDQLRELSKAHKQPLKSRAGSMTERLVLAAGEGVRLRKGELPSWLSPRGEIFRHQVRLLYSHPRNARFVLSGMLICPPTVTHKTDQQEERYNQVG